MYLGDYGLTGKIPKEIFELPYLRSLGFPLNDVDISLANIGKASRLEILLLSGTNVKSLDGIQNAGRKFKQLHFAKNDPLIISHFGFQCKVR